MRERISALYIKQMAEKREMQGDPLTLRRS
jgi:hypothetical protein